MEKQMLVFAGAHQMATPYATNVCTDYGIVRWNAHSVEWLEQVYTK